MAYKEGSSQFRTMVRAAVAGAWISCAAPAGASTEDFVGPPADAAPEIARQHEIPTRSDPAPTSNAPIEITDSAESSELSESAEPAASEPAPFEPQLTQPAARPAPATESLPLAPTKAVTPLQNGAGEPATSSGGWSRSVGALLLVVALIFGIRWGIQRLSRRASGLAWQVGPGGRAPSGVLEVLGRYPVSRGQTLVLLKMDRRVLLLGQSSSGFQTLAEVTDPDEVASLLIKTRDEEGASLAARFTEMLREMERDPSIVGEAQDIEAGEPATGPRLPRIGLRGVTA